MKYRVVIVLESLGRSEDVCFLSACEPTFRQKTLSGSQV